MEKGQKISQSLSTSIMTDEVLIESFIRVEVVDQRKFLNLRGHVKLLILKVFLQGGHKREFLKGRNDDWTKLLKGFEQIH